MSECDKVGCNSARLGNLTVSDMSASEAQAYLSDMLSENLGESWIAAILSKHTKHAS